jgi:hypothetical protein
MDTKVKTKALANEPGVYSFPNLPPGKYKLAVEAPGFATYTMKDVTLIAMDAKSVDIVMQKIKGKDEKEVMFKGRPNWSFQ